jgi:hypothetical protein
MHFIKDSTSCLACPVVILRSQSKESLKQDLFIIYIRWCIHNNPTHLFNLRMNVSETLTATHS